MDDFFEVLGVLMLFGFIAAVVLGAIVLIALA